MRQYFKERKWSNKDRIMQHFDGKCAHCGLIDDPCVYDLHHINPAEKEEGIARMMDRKWETILPELNKCILLCSNCHRKVHFSRDKH